MAEMREAQFPSVSDAQERVFGLFTLAQEGNVEIRSLVNGEPEPENLGRISLQKLISRVEMRGQRSDIIDLLLNMDKAMLISDVSFNGTAEDWLIQFMLTQFITPA